MDIADHQHRYFADVPIIGKYYFLQETRGVFEVIEKLSGNGNWFPAILILLFGIVVPGTKSIFISLFLFPVEYLQKWGHFLSIISKWAMSDVFAKVILIAFWQQTALGKRTKISVKGFYCFFEHLRLPGSTFMVMGLTMSSCLKNTLCF